jgi:methylmalonyl-CoA/ethylmalonyl-CoA epimerase
MLSQIDHIAIVVKDLDQAISTYRDGLGMELERVEDVPAEKVKVAFLPLPHGDAEIELVQPTDTETGIGRYLEKRGEGMHHICFRVEDIEAAMKQLQEQGLQLLEEKPRIGNRGQKYVFLHPKSANGVLIELYQLP